MTPQTVQIIRSESAPYSGTAASSYHLPESIDWSNFSMRIKNQVIFIPIHTQTLTTSYKRESPLSSEA